VAVRNLQQITAQQLNLSPVLAAAATARARDGKMIDAQSIVVAGVQPDKRVARAPPGYVFFHSITLAVLVGVLVFVQAYVFPHRTLNAP